jgi:hypothetical protein
MTRVICVGDVGVIQLNRKESIGGDIVVINMGVSYACEVQHVEGVTLGQ